MVKHAADTPCYDAGNLIIAPVTVIICCGLILIATSKFFFFIPGYAGGHQKLGVLTFSAHQQKLYRIIEIHTSHKMRVTKHKETKEEKIEYLEQIKADYWFPGEITYPDG